MNAWLQRMNPRERVIVVTGMVLAALVAVYLLIAEPLLQKLDDERARLDSQKALLEWMHTSAAEVRQLRGSGRQVDKSDQAPYLLLDAAVRKSGLPAPVRLEPRGRDGAAAQFENVPFDRLVRMLGSIERRGELSIEDVSITRRETAVNATLTLRRVP